MSSAITCIFAIAFWTLAEEIDGNNCIQPEPFSADSQCLIQSRRFHRSAGSVSEDSIVDDEGEDGRTDFSTFVDECGGKFRNRSEFENQGVEPRCKATADCESRPNKKVACISGFCTDPSKVKFDWAPAAVDSYCPCHDLGKHTRSPARLGDCKKKCEEMAGCTGFTMGKTGNVDSLCWFFSTCIQQTAQTQLKKDGKFDVHFLRAQSEIEVPVKEIKRMVVKFRGRTKPPEETDPSKCLSSGQCNDLPGLVLDPPLRCINGVCHDKKTEKFTWTLATVDFMCKVGGEGYLGKLTGRNILDCKKKCEALQGCTGFNRGKKGKLKGQCWFFNRCGKHTRRYFKRHSDYNMYFVTGVSTVPLIWNTYRVQPVVLRG
eukprot:gnl/MRDRNA2_/MRDRNA2_116336_c0_seq1.p1 gnl/MRDRNA2_/MRDRNA2_116336_c0~~gnl/MRDRNA2_/MRDRNA2_116336_c0_seq1.p1  ORF type:complete len:374 (+),score=47.00 gnl/MRDRNA2_/MRDRNA2_116336_c0_seq1:127-1248(+)